MTRKVTTLVYALRDGQVLMMRRRKWPNLGQWTAPGGKVEEDESPAECAARELREETGLIAGRPELRVIATETSPAGEWQWLMFIYLVRELSGELVDVCQEGDLAWVAVDQVPQLDIPQADRLFYPHVVDGAPGPISMKFEYDGEERLVAWRIE